MFDFTFINESFAVVTLPTAIAKANMVVGDVGISPLTGLPSAPVALVTTTPNGVTWRVTVGWLNGTSKDDVALTLDTHQVRGDRRVLDMLAAHAGKMVRITTRGKRVVDVTPVTPQKAGRK